MATTALSKKEMDFYDRINAATRILSAPGISFAEAAQEFLDEHPQLDLKEAHLWLNKGLEIIEKGHEQDIKKATSKYIANLDWMENTLRRKMVEDFEEVTETSEGAGIAIVVGQDKDGKGDVKDVSAMPTVTTKKKRRKAVINVPLASLLFKVMKEKAIVTGGRPKDVSIRANITNNNLNVGASKLSELPNADLLAQLGLTNAKILPQSAAERPHPVVADVESVPVDREVGDG